MNRDAQNILSELAVEHKLVLGGAKGSSAVKLDGVGWQTRGFYCRIAVGFPDENYAFACAPGPPCALESENLETNMQNLAPIDWRGYGFGLEVVEGVCERSKGHNLNPGRERGVESHFRLLVLVFEGRFGELLQEGKSGSAKHFPGSRGEKKCDVHASLGAGQHHFEVGSARALDLV